MEQGKILTADVLDIIFEGRNKDYGAYDLRKKVAFRVGMLEEDTAAYTALHSA